MDGAAHAVRGLPLLPGSEEAHLRKGHPEGDEEGQEARMERRDAMNADDVLFLLAILLPISFVLSIAIGEIVR